MNASSLQIGVIGGSSGSLPEDKDSRNKILSAAEHVGRSLALYGVVLLTGGTDGVMEAASKGAFEAGGITIGTPGRNRGKCNPFVSVEICTPIDVGDYLFILGSVDSLIVFPGGAGTLAEIALAYRMKIPMVIFTGLGGEWDKYVGHTLDSSLGKLRFRGHSSANEVVLLAIKLAKRNRM